MATTFYLFPLLPLELQDSIWRESFINAPSHRSECHDTASRINGNIRYGPPDPNPWNCVRTCWCYRFWTVFGPSVSYPPVFIWIARGDEQDHKLLLKSGNPATLAVLTLLHASSRARLVVSEEWKRRLEVAAAAGLDNLGDMPLTMLILETELDRLRKRRF